MKNPSRLALIADTKAVKREKTVRRTLVHSAAALLLSICMLPAEGSELIDKCVGGRWNDLLGQLGVVHSRVHPELGLSEKLSFDCPAFVTQVLFAESLDVATKRSVFENVDTWQSEKKLVFYLKLRMENEKTSEEFFGRKLP
jgi:hypothetical protein